MIRAYQEIYLTNAQSKLGDAFDYAVNICGIPGEQFVQLFATSTLSRRLAKGDPAVIAGKSGIEIAVDAILETTGKSPEAKPVDRLGRSVEYWIGWAVAYYQWYSDRSFSEIFRALSFDELYGLYPTLHEADISKFVDVADKRLRTHFKDTNLKRIRTIYGCTQSALAERSGVTLRSIQMYEQRRKDINKASANTVYRLSKVLGCTMEDLIEKYNA